MEVRRGEIPFFKGYVWIMAMRGERSSATPNGNLAVVDMAPITYFQA